MTTTIRGAQPELDAFYARVFGPNGHHDTPPPGAAGNGSPPLTDAQVIAKARGAKNGAAFDRLFLAGDTSGHGDDDSGADLGLLSHLTFYTQDPAQLDRLFRRSGLMRPKWEERADYRQRTIAKALDRAETWSPSGRAAGADGPHRDRSGADGAEGRPQNPRNPRTAEDADPFEDFEDIEDAPAPWEEPTPLPEGERPPFPTATLPEALRRFVDALAWATQTPPALAALMVLAVVAAAAAKRVAVLVRPGWREPVNLYTTTALDSGNRKSAVVSEATAPLRAHEKAEAKRMAAETAKAESRRTIAEKALEKAQRKAADGEGAEYWKWREEADRLAADLVANPDLQVPRPTRLLAEDATPEKYAALMADHGGRLAVLSAEGGVFDIMAGRFSKDGKSPNLDLFLKAHAGDDLPIDRIGRPARPLTAPALTLGLAVQRHVLRGMMARPGFRGTGLLARFAYAMPESFVGRRTINPAPVPADVEEAYQAVVAAILALPGRADEDGSPKPYDLEPSVEAAVRLLRFETELEPRLGPEGDLGHVADWGAKLAGLVARIAGVFHTAEHAAGPLHPWEVEIGVESVEAAVVLAEAFLIPHALTAFGEMGADPALETARLVLAALARWNEPTFSRRDLYQSSMKRRVQSPDELDRPLALLAEHGYVRSLAPLKPHDPTKNPVGRPRSDRFEINPRWRPRYSRNPHNGTGVGGSEVSGDIEDGRPTGDAEEEAA